MTDNRRYVRMNTVFPVELEFAGRGRLIQGFTSNVSEGGLCVEFKTLDPKEEALHVQPGSDIRLAINPPFTTDPIRAVAKVVWTKRQETPLPARHLLGIEYVEIDKRSRQRLIAYARRLRWVPRLVAAAAVAVAVLVALLFIREEKLVLENRRLVESLKASAEQKSSVAKKLTMLQEKRLELDKNLRLAKQHISNLEQSVAAQAADAGQNQALEAELAQSRREQSRLDAELAAIEKGREALDEKLSTLRRAEKPAADAAFERMYGWLRSHQNKKTGLIASFEGDAALEDLAFTYDQSLACQTFLLFGDTEDAAGILSFFESRAKRTGGAFFNAYSTSDGSVVENRVHTGPNVWLGIAALQYGRRTGDKRFLGLARGLGDWALGMRDAEGGLKGGPDVSWYSTEHNLDAYAFFGMLAAETGDRKFSEAQKRALEWLKKYAYTSKERRMNRGKGDATISTDTFSWAIAALGPGTLAAMNFDPEGIMEFAEQNCGVTVEYTDAAGKPVKASGFDFAKSQNLGRGGVISTEWTAQIIVAYQLMADHFRTAGDVQKAGLYRDKAGFYLAELQKMIITSSSRTGQGRGCLPYASADNVDTGHGWRTPKGKRTGSVAGTAYGLFAWAGYNPFNLEDAQKKAFFQDRERV